MKRSHTIQKYRNIGIIAHIDSGKTTVSERILFYTGKTHRMGEVHDGNTTLDYLVQEKQRGITITSAATTCFWSGTDKQFEEHRINLIDTPGHIDFGIEVQRSLRVLDGAVSVFCAVGGVQPQSETVWKQANQYNVPRIAFVNKMDRVGANFDNVLNQIQSKLSAKVLPLTIPVGSEDNFKGIIDVIEQRKMVWHSDEFTIEELSVDEKLKIDSLLSMYYEICAEANDALMDKFINNIALTKDELYGAIRQLTIENKIVPVCCGSAFKNKGVQFLLDSVIRFLPSPLDVVPQKAIVNDVEESIIADDAKPFVGLVFKVTSDPHVGQISFFRVYQGMLSGNSDIFIPAKNKTEHIGRIVEMHANQQLPRDAVFAGDIAAIIGLKNVITGTTLTEKNLDLTLESIITLDPVVFASIETANDTEQKKLGMALNKMMLEDPSLSIKVNEETGQSVIGGRGELHLEVMADRLRTEHNVHVRLGKPEVAFRETITKEIEVEGKYIKQTGGKGHHGHVWIKFKPLPIGSGIVFKNEIKGGVIPQNFVSSIEQGIHNGALKGFLINSPVTDFEATVFDGSTHRVDSSEMDFKLAAEDALKKALSKAEAVILEPIMKMEVICPEDNFGTVIGLLSSLRGSIENTSDAHGSKVVNALVPLQNLFGFTNTLRSQTQGRASSSMEFAKYAHTNTKVIM